MKKLLALLLIVPSLAFAQQVGSYPPFSPGQIPGTRTNDSANAGNVGEYISSNVASPGVTLTTGTTANVTSVSLTAGDWDCWGNVITLPGGTTLTAFLVGAISTTSATLPVAPGAGAYAATGPAGGAGFNLGAPVGTSRVSLAATTTVFLVAQGAFTVSTLSAYGFLGCRRAR